MSRKHLQHLRWTLDPRLVSPDWSKRDDSAISHRIAELAFPTIQRARSAVTQSDSAVLPPPPIAPFFFFYYRVTAQLCEEYYPRTECHCLEPSRVSEASFTVRLSRDQPFISRKNDWE